MNPEYFLYIPLTIPKQSIYIQFLKSIWTSAVVLKFCRDFGRFIPLPAASDLVELMDGVDLWNGVIVRLGH